MIGANRLRRWRLKVPGLDIDDSASSHVIMAASLEPGDRDGNAWATA